jgi:hypothetical protein
MAKPVSIGDRRFPTKTAAPEECRQIRDKYTGADIDSSPAGSETVSDPEDIALLSDLIRVHPEAEEKIGSGVDHFEVRFYDYGTRGFCAVRTDGCAIDFSFKECVNNAAASA